MATLQQYLEQLYQKAAQNHNNPRLRDAAIQQGNLDARNQSQTPPRRPQGIGNSVPYYLERERTQGPVSSNAIPNMNLSSLGRNEHDAHHTNQRPVGSDVGTMGANNQLAAYLDQLRGNHQRAVDDGSLATAQEQIANGGPIDPLADIESQIRSLLGKPDIPGHWESEYSQDYLNQLGDRLANAGGAAQQQFADAKNEIAANYQGGIDQRAQMQGGLVGALQGNGANIGVDYGASQQGQQASQDMAYLSQVAETNKASDLTSNDRLGVLANQFGANLGSQAREGLLTPKTWIDAQSGISSGDQALASFLQNKYNGLFDAQTDAAAAGANGDMFANLAKSLTNTADQDQVQNWPDLVQGLAGIKDPRTMDEANRIWNMFGDPQEAVSFLETDYKDENPDMFKTPTAPSWMPTNGPMGKVGSPEYNKYMQNIRSYQEDIAKWGRDRPDLKNQQQQAMWKYLIDFFNKYNPNRNPVTTANKVSNSSSDKYTN